MCFKKRLIAQKCAIFEDFKACFFLDAWACVFLPPSYCYDLSLWQAVLLLDMPVGRGSQGPDGPCFHWDNQMLFSPAPPQIFRPIQSLRRWLLNQVWTFCCRLSSSNASRCPRLFVMDCSENIIFPELDDAELTDYWVNPKHSSFFDSLRFDIDSIVVVGNCNLSWFNPPWEFECRLDVQYASYLTDKKVISHHDDGSMKKSTRQNSKKRT